MKNGISHYNTPHLNKLKLDTSIDKKKNNKYINRYNGSIGRIKRTSMLLSNSKYNRTPKLDSHSFNNYSIIKNSGLKRKDSFKSIYTENNLNINPKYDLLLNLKKTLKNTERIRHKILNRINHKKIIPDKISKSYILKTSYKDNDNYIKKIEGQNNYENKSEIENDNINNIIFNKEKNLDDNLNIQRNNLMEINNEIRKENRILETEINKYQKQLLENGNIFKRSNESLNNKDFNFINYIKNKLKSSLQNNYKIMEKIFEIQENNNNIREKIKKLYIKNDRVFKKIEEKNRVNAEIEIINEENEQQINILKDKNEMFKKKAERLKFELEDIINQQNNLKILKDSELKKLNDNE